MKTSLIIQGVIEKGKDIESIEEEGGDREAAAILLENIGEIDFSNSRDAIDTWTFIIMILRKHGIKFFAQISPEPEDIDGMLKELSQLTKNNKFGGSN